MSRHAARTPSSGPTASGPNTSRARDGAIETMRGLACLLLVLYHVIGRPGSGLDVDPGSLLDQFQRLLAYIRMPMFTFLSGYVYAIRPIRSGYIPFVRGKARRLLVPMLVIGTVFALVQSRIPGTNDEAGPWYRWHIYPVAHFWFLEAVFLIFVVVALLDMNKMLDKFSYCAIAVALVVLVNVAVPAGTTVFSWRNAIYLAPFFLAGLAARRFDWRSSGPVAKTCAWAVTVSSALWVLAGVVGWAPVTAIARNPIAFALGIALCLIVLSLNVTWSPLVYIGAFSFTIYTCHVFATSASRIGLNRLGVESVPVLIAVGLTMGIVVPVLVEKIARRFRLTRLLILGQRWSERVKT